jgi:hypothetical protein
MFDSIHPAPGGDTKPHSSNRHPGHEATAVRLGRLRVYWLPTAVAEILVHGKTEGVGLK